MALYPVRCATCGHVDEQVHPMPKQGGAPAFNPCSKCYGDVTRVITLPNEVGTGNRMHHIVDHCLTRGFEPAVFNSRRDWEAAMRREGVRPMERGDAEQQVRNEAAHVEKCRKKFNANMEQRADKAIDKAIATIGGM